MISFFVPGIPKPGGSKRIFPIKRGGVPTGKFIVTDAAGQANKDWRATVVSFAFEAMKAAGVTPFETALELTLHFRMPRPKYHFDRHGGLKPDAPVYHTIAPDATKLTRAVEDALKGVVYRDDCLIARQEISKVYADSPGCDVTVRAIESLGVPAQDDQQPIKPVSAEADAPPGDGTAFWIADLNGAPHVFQGSGTLVALVGRADENDIAVLPRHAVTFDQP